LPHYTDYVDVRRAVPAAFFLLICFPGALRGADRPVLVCYGDSITAGYGLDEDKAYPALLENLLDARGYNDKVVNQGTSGATTKDAVAELPNVLRLHPAIVIVEFGGNDGLRGLPIDQSERNLDQVVSALESAHIKVVVAGITLPPEYGTDYIHSFEQMFRVVAARHHVILIPMLYKDLVHVPGTIQGDGIHPTAKGSAIIADTVFAALKPLLRKGP
jgi:acyl-CoA thioesterase I